MLVARHVELVTRQPNPTTENDDILRIIIKYNRIISYHFVFAVSNRNRIHPAQKRIQMDTIREF